MDDFDTSGWDLGIDWGGILPGGDTLDGGTLDPFFVDTTRDDGDPFAWNGIDDISTPYDWGNNIGDLTDIGDPLSDIGGVYIPNTTPPAQTGTTPRPPTNNNPPQRPPTTPPSSSPSRPTTSGSAATDLAKLVNSILQAIKGTQPATATGQPVSTPGPVATGFDVGSLALLAGGALIAWLVLRKK